MMMTMLWTENHRHSRCRLRKQIGACTDAIKTSHLNGKDDYDNDDVVEIHIDPPRAVRFGPAAYFLIEPSCLG